MEEIAHSELVISTPCLTFTMVSFDEDYLLFFFKDSMK